MLHDIERFMNYLEENSKWVGGQELSEGEEEIEDERRNVRVVTDRPIGFNGDATDIIERR